jgi:hypothetical protein
MNNSSAAGCWTDVTRFPRLIPLGRPTDRPVMPPFRAPADVVGASDLPRELFTSVLRPESFLARDDGWDVRYVGNTPDTFIDVSYERSAGALTASHVWRGVPGPVTTVKRNRWEELTTAFVLGAPSDWDSVLQERLMGRFNVRYEIGPLEPRRFILFPTALFNRIICPIPITQLRRAVAALYEMRADPEIGRTGPARLEWTISAVEYRDGEGLASPTNPAEAAILTRTHLGLLPIEPPKAYAGSDGDRVLMVRRAHYNVVVCCAFADVERVIEHLYRARVVGGACPTGGEEVHLSQPEFRAIVMPDDVRWKWIRFSDSESARRITYVPYERLWQRSVDEDGAWHPSVSLHVIEAGIQAAERARAEVLNSSVVDTEP